MKYQNYIRKMREKRGLSQEQLAQKLNTTNPQISNLELGKRRLTWEWMQRLAGALECQPLDLVENADRTDTHAEKNLLDTYRALDPHQQEAVHKMATFLHESKAPSFKSQVSGQKKK